MAIFQKESEHVPKNLETVTTDLEIRELSEDGEFEGYASLFGVVDTTQDIIEKGAFKKSLRAKKLPQIKMLFQHDPSQPIGVWKEMKEDDRGLFVRGKLLTKLNKGAEVLEMLRAEALDGLSIGFRSVKFAYERAKESGDMIRRLKEVDLWEVSVVTFPAALDARISGVKGMWQKRDVERVLREAGAPNQFAKLVASKGYDEASTLLSSDLREVDGDWRGVAEALRQNLTALRE